MNVLEMAVKATLEKFADFVSNTAGVKKDKNGEAVLTKEGKTTPVNSRGNLSFLFNGITFADEAEAIEYCHVNKVSVADVIAAAINDAKGSAARSAVGEVSGSIPETETVNDETLAIWTAKAQDAAHIAADKVIAPEISSRAAKQALETKVSNLTSQMQSGAEVDRDELLAAFLSLREMEK